MQDAPTTPLTSEAAASRRIPWPVAALGLLAALLTLVLWFGHELMEGDGARIDRAIMLAMRVPGHPEQPAGPVWLPSVVRDVTSLGSTTVLTLVVAIVAIFLALHRHRRGALLVVAATGLGALLVTIVKLLVARSRPDIFTALMVETSHSFPSGHAANSAIVYLTLATLLFPVIGERRLRAFIFGVAILLVAMIGVSRVYLGVHWPSDVLAGWAFGAAWAMLWWRVELKVFGKAPALRP